MATTPTVYVLCDLNCKFEGMTKEQILTAIANAVSTGEIGDINTGFVQTIKTINNIPLKFFVGTQAEYNALTAEDKRNLYAIITDDISVSRLETIVEAVVQDQTELRDSLQSGALSVENANNATNATNADYAKLATFAQNADEASISDNARCAFKIGKSVWSGHKQIPTSTSASVSANEQLFDRWLVVEIEYYVDGYKEHSVRTPQFKVSNWYPFIFTVNRETVSSSVYLSFMPSGNELTINNESGNGDFRITNIFVAD